MIEISFNDSLEQIIFLCASCKHKVTDLALYLHQQWCQVIIELSVIESVITWILVGGGSTDLCTLRYIANQLLEGIIPSSQLLELGLSLPHTLACC